MARHEPLPEGDSSALLGLYRELGDVVAELAAESHGIADAGRRLADFAVHHLGADIAVIFRHPRRGGREVIAATDDIVAVLDAVRDVDTGLPGGTALAEGEVLLDTASADRGPQTWHAVAEQLELRSALMVGLPPLSSGPVTLELYSRRHAAFAAVSSEIAGLARLGGVALRDVERRANLEEALHTRDLIGRAQGVLMERYRLTGEQAMSYLRRHSQQSQQPIRELAADVIGQRESESQTAQLGADPD